MVEDHVCISTAFQKMSATLPNEKFCNGVGALFGEGGGEHELWQYKTETKYN